jgi:pimeloyl-ACP methyl ester carboxylesterase
MRFHGLPAAAGLLLLIACVDDPAGPVSISPRVLAGNGSANAVWAKEIVSQTGPGSSYGIWVPEDWNGDVVFYAHGFRDPAAPVDLNTDDQIEAIRNGLGERHYAVAYSSFSSNGFNVLDGVRRTHQLRGLFTSKVGKPARSYLWGRSLGAVVSQSLLESHASQYDGALLVCGEVGGFVFELNYFGNLRALFDYFYPGVLPGGVDHMPANVNPITDIAIPAQTAILSNPVPFSQLLQIDNLYLPGANFVEKVTSMLNVLGFHARAVNDILERAHGRLPFDNWNLQYTSATLTAAELDAINDGVFRNAITPDGTAFLKRSYEPTGEISVPVLTLHGQRDYTAPIQNEQIYLTRVTNAGNADLLVQRTFNTFGHCVFDVNATTAIQLQLTAFDQLANWVVNSVKPVP